MTDESPKNFWQFLVLIWGFWSSHGTKILGAILGTLTILSFSGVIPKGDLHWYTAAVAVLTYWRGLFNSDQIADKIIEKTQPPPETPK